MQKGRRRLRQLGANLTMGFEIYEVSNRKPRDAVRSRKKDYRCII